ncbi:MAG: sigma-70 family RNA polymerase sigma factor [Acidobacteria bacterium]|nr:sigma-70 family RNA polymerase sigma factor [Acidobacteriota bacterium]
MAAGAESRLGLKRAHFEAAAVPFMTALYNTALRLTRRPEDASDLVQETYLRSYRTFENFVPGTNCKAWLFTVLYSVFINTYRKAKREPEPMSLDELEERFHQAAVAAPADSDAVLMPGAHIHGASPEVDEALGQLPDAFRSVVLFVDVEQLSYEEAAEALKCPVGTVRSRLFRARKMLFVALQAYARRTGYLNATPRNESRSAERGAGDPASARPGGVKGSPPLKQ